MGHEHNVRDLDARFTIDPVTRQIKNESKKKLLLIQGDHNSEIFGFRCPRYVESHDMSLCNEIEVHYFNYDTQTNKVNSGIYYVEDLQVGEDEDTVEFSWSISGNGTQLHGRLEFLIRFKCKENGIVTYAWNTAFFTETNIGKGSNADSLFEKEYVDIIEQWKAKVMQTFKDDLTAWKTVTAEAVRKEAFEDIATERKRIDFLSNYVTPEMFGAKGDGVTDDTEALQRMIDSAAEGLHHIRFATMGKYYISDTLNVPDGVIIDFNHSTIETVHEIKVPAILVGGNNVELHNLHLCEKNPDGSDNTGLLVHGSGLSNINLNNIHTNGFMIGIEVTSTEEAVNQNVKVKNCSATKAGSYGMFISFCDGCYIENFNGCHNGLDGLKAGTHCSNVYVNGGEYSYNGIPASEGGTGYGDGIDLYAGGYKFKIIGITCKGNLGAGIHIMNGIYNIEGQEGYNGCVVKDVIVSGCLIENNVGNGIDAIVLNEAPDAPKPQNIIITNNCMIGNGRGVQLNAVDCVVSDNIIRDTIESGIYITNSIRVSVENNTIINPTNQGIYVSNSKDIMISKGFIDGESGTMQRAILLDSKSNDNSALVEDVVMQNYDEECPVLVTNKNQYPNVKNVIKLHKVQEDKLNSYYGFTAGSMVVVAGKAYFKNTDDINRADFYKIPLWRSGTASFAGDGSTTTFAIAHGCGTKPDIFNVTPRMLGAAIPFTVQCDETNLNVQFKEPLPKGNYSMNWNTWF